jgi:hypothetical protein
MPSVAILRTTFYGRVFDCDMIHRFADHQGGIQFEMRAKNGFGALRAHVVTCTFKETKEGYAFGNIEIRQL